MRQDINSVFPPPLTSLGQDAAEYAAEIHHRAVRPSVYRQIIARGVDDIWSIDLATMYGFKDNWYGRPTENVLLLPSC